MMSRHRFTKSEQISGGAAAGRITFETKTGIHTIPPEERKENSVRGGRTQGPIQGAKNRDSGQLDRIRQLPQTKAAQSAVGKITGKATGLKYGPLNDMSKIKTRESLRLGQANGGDKSRHIRWHFNRRVFNFSYQLCLYAISRKENWGVVVYEPD